MREMCHSLWPEVHRLKLLTNDEASLTWLFISNMLWVGRKSFVAGLVILPDCTWAHLHMPICFMVCFVKSSLPWKPFLCVAVCIHCFTRTNNAFLCFLAMIWKNEWNFWVLFFFSHHLVTSFKHQLKVMVRVERGREREDHVSESWQKVDECSTTIGSEWE